MGSRNLASTPAAQTPRRQRETLVELVRVRAARVCPWQVMIVASGGAGQRLTASSDVRERATETAQEAAEAWPLALPMHSSHRSFACLVCAAAGRLTEVQHALGHQHLATTKRDARRSGLQKDRDRGIIARRLSLEEAPAPDGCLVDATLPHARQRRLRPFQPGPDFRGNLPAEQGSTFPARHPGR